jgi:hypothetical protein
MACFALALLISAGSRAEPSWQSASPWETDAERLCSAVTTERDQCEAEAAARLERRREAAPSLTREQLAQIPDELLIAEERQRIAELAFAEMRAARLERDARRRDKRWMRPALSAAYCTYSRMRAEALARRSRLPSGEQIEMTRRAADYQRSMKTIAIALRAWASTPTACDDPLTVQIQSCMAPENSRSGCSAEILRYVELTPKIYR